MLTPFGRELRKLRVDRDLRLLDLAEKLGQSVAAVSAIETGRRPIPLDYVKLLSLNLNLSASVTERLQVAADQTHTEVQVGNLPVRDRELVAAFARSVSGLTDDQISDIRKLFRSTEWDRPFHRRRRGWVVNPTSRDALTGAAERIRSAFIPPERVNFPVMRVVEMALPRIDPDFYLEICDRDVMGADEGRVMAGGTSIMLRSDVYKAACDDIGRARFTVCHELAHYFLHRQIAMARQPDAGSPIYCDAEWQADEFAGRLLMSVRHASSFTSADQAASKCGMSVEAAQVMMSKYHKEGRM